MLPVLLLLLASVPSHAQSYIFGGPYEVDEYHYTTGAGWYLVNMDEGTRVSIEREGMVMAVSKTQGITFISTGCGYNARLGTFDNRTGSIVIITLPILIPNEVRVRVQTPPKGHIWFASELP